MAKKTSNPAARLHALLAEALKFPDNQHTGEVWRQVLGAPIGDHKTFLRLSHELLSLYAEVVERVEGFNKGDKKLFLKWTGPVSNVLTPMAYQNGWASTKTNLKPEVMDALEFTAERFDFVEAGTEETITADQLKKLLTDVEKLQKSIVESELDERVKSILWQQAENIRLAVHAYKIRGASAVRESLERAFGAVVINAKVFREVKHPIVERFKDLMLETYQSIEPILGIAAGAAAVKELLG